MKYIDRPGKLPIETDDRRMLAGREAAASLAEEWALDLCAGSRRPRPADRQQDQRPKLVHNIVLSMPGHTQPAAVLAAVRNFARENVALQYRYAMVLHTDQAHPMLIWSSNPSTSSSRGNGCSSGNRPCVTGASSSRHS